METPRPASQNRWTLTTNHPRIDAYETTQERRAVFVV